MHGHGVRDRQLLGPPEVNAASTMTIVACQRYLCTSCGAVVMVVPRGIEPRRHYGRAAICLALAAWFVPGFTIGGFGSALIGALAISIISWLLSALLIDKKER